MNIKELKAKLSAYIRQVRSGETFLVTDRNHVVARLSPVESMTSATAGVTDTLAKLASLGSRPPLRERRQTDYIRHSETSGMSTQQIDELLNWSRGEFK